MRHADPQSLRLFMAVCDCGSITRAAEREAIAPSALSRRISDLEELLGAVLLTRSQRGVNPTAAGKSLLEHAPLVLRSLQRMHSEVGEHAEGIRGDVRLLAISSAIVPGLQQNLSDFLAHFPQVSLTLDERLSADVTRGVLNGVAEIGICREFEPCRELRTYPYGHDTLAVVVAPSHPLAARERVDFVDTLDFPFCAGQGGAYHKFTDRVANEMGRSINYRISVSHPRTAIKFIADGLALGIFPAEAIGEYTEAYDLRVVPLTDDWARRAQFICISAIEPLSPAARRLVQSLRQSKEPTTLAQV